MMTAVLLSNTIFIFGVCLSFGFDGGALVRSLPPSHGELSHRCD
jgi:hypothetical protein